MFKNLLKDIQNFIRNKRKQRHQERDDLSFRIGGVGITKVNYEKAVENHIEFLKKLAGASFEKDEVVKNEYKVVVKDS